jgi:hypothetical protein
MVAHAALTGAELHEPKGADGASANTVYIADGAGSGDWNILDYNSLPNGTVIGFAYTQSQTGADYTSTIPSDNTIPQNTEGTEVLSVSITPKSNTSLLKVEVQLTASENGNTADFLTAALFLNSETDARAAVNIGAQSGNPLGNNGSLIYTMISGSTSTKTFKVRCGADISASWSLNKNWYGDTLGGAFISSITVTEIKA